MDLDPANFTDEAFTSVVSIKPRRVEGEGSPTKRKVKDSENMTNDIFYRDIETNTKHKNEAVAVNNFFHSLDLN